MKIKSIPGLTCYVKNPKKTVKFYVQEKIGTERQDPI